MNHYYRNIQQQLAMIREDLPYDKSLQSMRFASKSAHLKCRNRSISPITQKHPLLMDQQYRLIREIVLSMKTANNNMQMFSQKIQILFIIALRLRAFKLKPKSTHKGQINKEYTTILNHQVTSSVRPSLLSTCRLPKK